jgi:hypothetical protein
MSPSESQPPVPPPTHHTALPAGQTAVEAVGPQVALSRPGGGAAWK